jgi:hypothetical protein
MRLSTATRVFTVSLVHCVASAHWLNNMMSRVTLQVEILFNDERVAQHHRRMLVSQTNKY